MRIAGQTATTRTLSIQQHIVTRIPRTPGTRPTNLPREDVELIDAWFWPTPELEARPEAQQEESASVDVSMLPPTRRLLRDFPVPGLEKPYLRHLEQRIVRNPRDLLSHVRRVYLASALNDSAAIAGALTDLYLVLGRAGRRLRRRLLSLVADQLGVDHLRFFESHLDCGLDETEATSDIPESRLSKRLLGTTSIVSRASDADEFRDPVRLALDSISKGHDDLAQAVLEGALETDPGNTPVSEALLALYAGRAMRDDFRKTYTALLGRRLACRDRWDEVAQRFRVSVNARE